MTPQRIQRKRTAGWRMPEDVIYVGRGSKYGNPFRVATPEPQEGNAIYTPEKAVANFRTLVEYINNNAHKFPENPLIYAHLRRDLKGKTLACWCDTDQPCHADVLIELANSK